MKTLYYSLIHSHLTYWPIIISCSNNNNLKKIYMVQQKAIWIIDNKRYNDHTAPIFKKLEILPYDKLIKLAKLKFMHAVTYNYSSTSFTGVGCGPPMMIAVLRKRAILPRFRFWVPNFFSTVPTPVPVPAPVPVSASASVPVPTLKF
jgi:hypothetical protein